MVKLFGKFIKVFTFVFKVFIKLFKIGTVLSVALIPFLILADIIDLSVFEPGRYKVKSDKITKKLRAVYIADLHGKRYGKGNSKLLKAIRKENPDIILCGGDMITAAKGNGYETASSFMKELLKDYLVYYSNGNHEYRARIYPETYKSLYYDYMSDIESDNLKVLVNEGFYLEDYNIEITGLEIDRRFYKKLRIVKMDDGYVKSELGDKNEDRYTVLLAHNPDYFKKYSKWGADLTLSGHLHGGLVRFPLFGGMASPGVRFFPKYSGGVYRKNNRHLIVSRGLGTHTIPLRLFDPGELVVIDFEPSCDED